MSDIEEIQPGDYMAIRGHSFRVLGRGTTAPMPASSSDLKVIGFTVLADEREPLTDKTVSRLKTRETPYILDVCNGGEIGIQPDEVVRELDTDTEQGESDA